MNVKAALALKSIQDGFVTQDAQMYARQKRAVDLRAERKKLNDAITELVQIGDHTSIAVIGQKIGEIDRELQNNHGA